MSVPKLSFPGPGLIKTAPPQTPPISAGQKAALIRKGNELFNLGNIEQAKKVFLTTHYTDGLVRIGDHYYKQNRFLLALQMYVIAPDSFKRDRLVQKMAGVVRNWLSEDNASDNRMQPSQSQNAIDKSPAE